jgi:PAS domain S-box-containing protein
MNGDEAGEAPNDERGELAVARARAAQFEQKAAEYRRVLDAAPDPVFAFTRTGQYVYVNHDFARTVGQSPDDIIGKTLWDIFPKAAADARFGAVQQVFQTGEAATIEVTVQQPTGPRHFLTTAHPVRADGEVTAVVCSSKDITDRRRAEASKVQLEAQLHHAQKMESVGRLAGGVAHDFNNLLGVILGNLEFALEKVDPSDDLFTDLREIQQAAERSARLTQQLLAFARRQTIAARVLDLNEAIGGTLSMLRRLIGENIQLEWQPGATPCTVKADPSQIDQILANLCVNARDAIGDNGTLTITTGRGTPTGAPQPEPESGAPTDEVWLAVRDDGCGMDADLVAHIFEPFFTTKPPGQGTGLGLATVYGIVKQNGGRIAVESAPGKGTTFTVHLPRYAGAAESLGPRKGMSLACLPPRRSSSSTTRRRSWR